MLCVCVLFGYAASHVINIDLNNDMQLELPN